MTINKALIMLMSVFSIVSVNKYYIRTLPQNVLNGTIVENNGQVTVMPTESKANRSKGMYRITEQPEHNVKKPTCTAGPTLFEPIEPKEPFVSCSTIPMEAIRPSRVHQRESHTIKTGVTFNPKTQAVIVTKDGYRTVNLYSRLIVTESIKS